MDFCVYIYEEERLPRRILVFKTQLIGSINEVTAQKRGAVKNNIREFAKANFGSEKKPKQRDLLYFTDIYVSQGWNLNDDIFLKDELLKSWDSVQYKPVDWDHDRDRIIGVVCASYITNKEGDKLTAEEALAYDGDIDIVSESVVYKWLFPTEAQAVLCSADIDSHDFNKYAVSMECYFSHYDYGFIDGEVTKIVKRDEKTGHLDSYLRVNGGKGIFNGKKMGRVLRDITFGGKGIVKNPANIESVIMCAAKINPDIVKEEPLVVVLSNVEEKVMAKENSGATIEEMIPKEQIEKLEEIKKEVPKVVEAEKVITEPVIAEEVKKEKEQVVVKADEAKSEEIKLEPSKASSDVYVATIVREYINTSTSSYKAPEAGCNCCKPSCCSPACGECTGTTENFKTRITRTFSDGTTSVEENETKSVTTYAELMEKLASLEASIAKINAKPIEAKADEVKPMEAMAEVKEPVKAEEAKVEEIKVEEKAVEVVKEEKKEEVKAEKKKETVKTADETEKKVEGKNEETKTDSITQKPTTPVETVTEKAEEKIEKTDEAPASEVDPGKVLDGIKPEKTEVILNIETKETPVSLADEYRNEFAELFDKTA